VFDSLKSEQNTKTRKIYSKTCNFFKKALKIIIVIKIAKFRSIISEEVKDGKK